MLKLRTIGLSDYSVLESLAATGLMLGINQRHILEILGGELVYVDR